ncbi:hypothetical protein BS47DRAFT_1127650 [Hydnum rufescens UP504]|uniref:Uncharacterized protein n=1 Tax=Hydnum rufescens UP504 TaxID=1448309 RepID=A0A9P6AU39_9AGAM|nr:hypothetical protein BS47DRAFT_1127650 [Hydnum rufescens UP504]
MDTFIEQTRWPSWTWSSPLPVVLCARILCHRRKWLGRRKLDRTEKDEGSISSVRLVLVSTRSNDLQKARLIAPCGPRCNAFQIVKSSLGIPIFSSVEDMQCHIPVVKNSSLANCEPRRGLRRAGVIKHCVINDWLKYLFQENRKTNKFYRSHRPDTSVYLACKNATTGKQGPC